jgi:hypothetical protein
LEEDAQTSGEKSETPNDIKMTVLALRRVAQEAGLELRVARNDVMDELKEIVATWDQLTQHLRDAVLQIIRFLPKSNATGPKNGSITDL